MLVVVRVKIFPSGTGIARLRFGPSTFWLCCLLSAACREVSLRVSMISADFSHTSPELCVKQNPSPACLFAMLLPQPRLPGGCGARTGTFSKQHHPVRSLLPLEGLCLSACRTWLVPNRTPPIPQPCCLQDAINNLGSTVQLQQLCAAWNHGWSRSKKVPPPNFRSAFSK